VSAVAAPSFPLPTVRELRERKTYFHEPNVNLKRFYEADQRGQVQWRRVDTMRVRGCGKSRNACGKTQHARIAPLVQAAHASMLFVVEYSGGSVYVTFQSKSSVESARMLCLLEPID
jgi:hypothetical protein